MGLGQYVYCIGHFTLSRESFTTELRTGLRPPSEEDPVVELEKSEGGPNERAEVNGVVTIRKLAGVLTPLGSPVLQGTSPAHLRVYLLIFPVDVAPLTKHRPIATLAHKLDRVLFK